MNQHYFSAAPEGEFRRRELLVDLAGAERSVVTAGGVFSPDGLDRGTAVLLRTLSGPDRASGESAPDDGPILDIGCGWGPIALAAALDEPTREVWAIDVNERSRALTAENAAGLGLSNIRVVAPEGVPQHLRFAEIRSNPPIRVGKDALHGILRQWLPRLVPGGAASLVVAKHLGADSLQRWIAAEFPGFVIERAARDKGFHVIRAQRERESDTDPAAPAPVPEPLVADPDGSPARSPLGNRPAAAPGDPGHPSGSSISPE